MLYWIVVFAGLTAGIGAQPASPGYAHLTTNLLAAHRQEPQPPAPPATGQTPEPDKKKKRSHAFDFLMIGTVFAEKGFSLEGAEVRIRRTGEKKFRWDTRTDRRGEFAVRVPQGAEYEIVARAHGYQEQTRKVDAKSGDREDLVFRMVPTAGGKSK